MKKKHRTLNKDWSFKNLIDLKWIFETYRIKYWIECGLLLGLYREGDMIAGDEEDIDIGIPLRYSHRLKKALWVIEKLGFIVKKLHYCKDGNIKNMALKRVSRIDIHLVDMKDDIVYFPMCKKNKMIGVYVYPYKLFHKLGIIEWRGVKFPCPRKVEEYLKIRYGEDWKVNKIDTGEWTNFKDEKLNPCLQYWKSEEVGKLL